MAVRNEVALCYFPDPAAPAAAAARRALLAGKVRIRAAGPGQTGQTVGHLLGRPGFEASEGENPAVPEPLMVFSGFTNERLYALLLSMGRQGVPKTVYQSVVTADNLHWTLDKLYQELKQEREAIAQGQTARHETGEDT